MIEPLQAGTIVYFSGHHVYTGAILVYLFMRKAKRVQHGHSKRLAPFPFFKVNFIALASAHSPQ